MYSLKRWMYKPKKTDNSILAQFFHADEALNQVAAELDSFDGRKDPERCTSLVNQLRACQDKVLVVVNKIIQQVITDNQANRHFRVKFPDDVLQESLAGQLWFGAECLAAGSSIMNREVESASMRPLAKALTKQLDYLRGLLRDQCLGGQSEFPVKTKQALITFDKLFAEFELSYVSAMVPVKSMREFDMLQEVVVLFCETVQRSLKLALLDQQMIDDYDPALMFTIPRLAIVCGLLVYPEGPINPDKDPMNMSEMFRPFQMLLYKIRELLWTLTQKELWLLEKALSRTEENFPLTDEAFEDQLNKLNLIEQTRNLHSVDIYGGAASDEGRMSPTATVVAASNIHSDAAVSNLRQTLDANQLQHTYVPEQDSYDTESTSTVSSSANPTLLSIVERSCRYHELQKSQSWPEAKESKCLSTCDKCQQHTSTEASEDFLCRRHLLERYDLEDSDQRVTRARNTGSSEFSFHLPQDSTAHQHSDGNHGPVPSRDSRALDVPSVSAAAILPENNEGSLSPDEVVDSASSQIAFVTEALNHHLLIDPSFETGEPVLVKPLSTASVNQGDENNLPKSSSTVAVTVHCDNLQSDVQSRTVSNLCDISENQMTEPQILLKSQTGGVDHTNNNSDSKVTTVKYSELEPGAGADAELTSAPCSLDYDWDRESCWSSDTDTSHSRDDAEITLAIQAAEASARQEARARFRSNSELIHKLFVCISGVADQLQTNYASDLRFILKEVFECNSTQPEDECVVSERKEKSVSSLPPEWTPDEQAPKCHGCKELFTFIRRRHHCRNCGKVFCGRCSSNNVPLPHFGHTKPVRVCNHCFMFQVTPFTVAE